MSDPTPESALHAELPDDTLLVFVSDVHIGGAAGTEIFHSPAELMALLENLGRHPGPVELVLTGDFLDLLRMGDVGRGEDLVAATIARPEYQELFAALRVFAQGPEHRVVYVVGNHDAELWWNPRIQQSLRQAGLVDVFALSYLASFVSQPEQLVYCEHGNQFDPSNTLVDYTNPLDSPVGVHVVTELVRPIGSGVAVTRSVDLREVSYVFPLAAIPQWVAGRIFYQFLGQVLRWLLAPLLAVYLAYEGVAAVVQAFGGSLALRPLFLEVAYVLGLLVVAFAVVFLISRRTTARAISTMAIHLPGQAPGQERYREDVAIRKLLAADQAPPMAGTASPMEIAVFVSGHTHAPGHVGVGTSQREEDGDRQHRLLAAPTAADRGAAGCPTGVRAHLRPHSRPRPSRPGRAGGRTLESPQAGRATPALDRTRRHRREDADPAAVRRRAPARGPGRGSPRRAHAPLSCRLGGCRLTVGLRARPISLLAGTASMETPPGPERITRRLREQFAPAYLAITGLVQVLVLDALISKVEGNYTEYGVVDWLLTVATFLVCVDIWHEYLMTVLSHVWLPGLLDSLVPFAFLVTELLMVHFVGDDLRGWLLGYGLVALVGVAAWAQRNLRIRQVADEERDLPLALATRHWYRAALAVAVTAFGLLGWLLYDPLGLDSVQVAVAAAGLVGVVAIIASSVPMWNQILKYAHGDRMSRQRP